MRNDLLVDEVQKLGGARPLVEIRIQAKPEEPLYNRMPRLTVPVQIQVVWHVNTALPNVLLDQVGVLLRVLAVEGISFRRDIIQAAAKRPNVCLLSQEIIRPAGQNLGRSVV